MREPKDDNMEWKDLRRSDIHDFYIKYIISAFDFIENDDTEEIKYFNA